MPKAVRFQVINKAPSKRARLCVSAPTEVVAAAHDLSPQEVVALQALQYRRKPGVPTYFEAAKDDAAATQFVVRPETLARAGTHYRSELLPPIHRALGRIADLSGGTAARNADPVRRVQYDYDEEARTVSFGAEVALLGADQFGYMANTTKRINQLAVSSGLSQFGHPKASTGIRFDPDKRAITMRMPSGAALQGRYDTGNSLRPPRLTLEVDRPVQGVEPLVLLGAAIILARTR